ncbi:MAG: CheY-like receiver, AAA-type ATPase and DNA-binding domain-containing response regulator [Desulfonauticus sp. 38_4375]|nr:MAG: CheY-like receiver, AAA-type ATPase and DNA-binding domain-containing response regulator [Desulfonauticus sp. 38_4375]
MTNTILIIDDEKIALKNLEHILNKDSYKVIAIDNPKKALQFLEKSEPDIVITDLKMPEIDGISILRKVKELYPNTEVILLTGYATVDTAVKAMKIGAYNYVEKPYNIDKIRSIVKEAITKRNLILENIKLKNELSKENILSKIKGESPQIKSVLKTIEQVAPTNTNILITGESGTGKELIARAIHELSPRKNYPFIAFNCGAFTEELIANELFGHEKGAFTGAYSFKKGLIEEANKGTLFLDEIGDMPLSQQVKLLRVIQEKELLRVGATKPVKIDVRFIAATHRNLQEEIEEGNFRQDLFFRLNVISITLPPLRERKEDIPILANYFLVKKTQEQQKNIKGFDPETIKFLKTYTWPGNIRELENVIERMVALSQNEILAPDDLPGYLKGMDIIIYNKDSSDIPSLEEVEKKYIYYVLEQCNFNKTKAAKLIGIDRVSLWRKLKKYNLEY